MYNQQWLAFTHSLPAGGGSGRVKVWRALQAMGAVQVASGPYVLPFSESGHERLIWLAAEIESMGGEALLIACERFENVTDATAREAFIRARGKDWRELEAEARRLLQDLQPGSSQARRQAKSLYRRLEALAAIDFFPMGDAARVRGLVDALDGKAETPREQDGRRLAIADYLGRVWVTRPRPYVDRLASFWLVRRFIDRDARVAFVENPVENAPQGAVVFDAPGGQFTHRGDRITFEVIAEDFGLGDPGLSRMFGLIRAVDVQDYADAGPGEAGVLKDLLDGLLATFPDDHALMDHALLVFDALHAANAAKD